MLVYIQPLPIDGLSCITLQVWAVILKLLRTRCSESEERERKGGGGGGGGREGLQREREREREREQLFTLLKRALCHPLLPIHGRGTTACLCARLRKESGQSARSLSYYDHSLHLCLYPKAASQRRV